MSTQMHINLFLAGVGHHEAAWRLPGSRPSCTARARALPSRGARRRGGQARLGVLRRHPRHGVNVKRNLMTAIEPTNLLAALAPATSRIGLIATASTSYNDPFNLARRFATIDHLSQRPGGLEHRHLGARGGGAQLQPRPPRRPRRPLRAGRPSSSRWRPRSGTAGRTARWSATRSRASSSTASGSTRSTTTGTLFRVAGPLGLPRSPQGRPVLVQAGSSEAGKDLAAEVAEAVFTAQRTLADGQAFYADLKGRAARAGRDPDGVKILPGISPFIGSTEAEARQVEQDLLDLRPDRLRAGPALAHARPGDRRGPCSTRSCRSCPARTRSNGAKSRFSLVVDMARAEDLTVRQLIGRLAGGRGHRTDRRHARAGRRRPPALVRERRRRRLQLHAAGDPGPARGLRRPGRADPAGARPLPRPSTRGRRCATTTGSTAR